MAANFGPFKVFPIVGASADLAGILFVFYRRMRKRSGKRNLPFTWPILAHDGQTGWKENRNVSTLAAREHDSWSRSCGTDIQYQNQPRYEIYVHVGQREEGNGRGRQRDRKTK